MSEIDTKIRITAEHEIVGSTNKLHSCKKRPPATSSPSCFSHISYSEKTSLEIYVGLQAFLLLIFQFQTKIYVNVFLGTLPKKKTGFFGNSSQRVWRVFSNPKTFVNLPSVFLCAKIILRCQNMFYKSGEVISDQFHHITLDSKSGKF